MTWFSKQKVSFGARVCLLAVAIVFCATISVELIPALLGAGLYLVLRLQRSFRLQLCYNACCKQTSEEPTATSLPEKIVDGMSGLLRSGKEGVVLCYERSCLECDRLGTAASRALDSLAEFIETAEIPILLAF